MHNFDEHLLQKIRPQLRQWWRRTHNENTTLHYVQFGASSSFCQTRFAILQFREIKTTVFILIVRKMKTKNKVVYNVIVYIKINLSTMLTYFLDSKY